MTQKLEGFMKIHALLALVTLSLFSPNFPLQAEDCCNQELFRHQAFAGPEIYYIKRTREGGANQNGYLYGARLGYDYIRRYAFYIGFDGLYAQGFLKGCSGEGDRIKSELTDANIEGRIGYTFQSKACHYFSFTPFVGIGYFWEFNDYQHPSPIQAYFKNTFYYVPVGFLSRVFFNPQLSVGLNFKARILVDGKVKVTHDEEAENSTQRYKEDWQYRIDVPLTYYFCWLNQDVAVSLVPFYEYRHYGHRVNFPFDFLDTKFRIYGGTLKLFYLF
jgi:hypothetical protein